MLVIIVIIIIMTEAMAPWYFRYVKNERLCEILNRVSRYFGLCGWGKNQKCASSKYSSSLLNIMHCILCSHEKSKYLIKLNQLVWFVKWLPAIGSKSQVKPPAPYSGFLQKQKKFFNLNYWTTSSAAKWQNTRGCTRFDRSCWISRLIRQLHCFLLFLVIIFTII